LRLQNARLAVGAAWSSNDKVAGSLRQFVASAPGVPSSAPQVEERSTSEDALPFHFTIDTPDRPQLATLLVFLGGVLVLIEGVIAVAYGVYGSTLGYGSSTVSITTAGWLGIALGLLLIIAAGLVTADPVVLHPRVGAVVMAVAILSLIAGGGFLVGLAFALGGGAMLFTWKPRSPFHIAPRGWEVCPYCGDGLKSGSERCPGCGKVWTGGSTRDENGDAQPGLGTGTEAPEAERQDFGSARTSDDPSPPTNTK
jgi:uncharacterized protein DUF6114